VRSRISPSGSLSVTAIAASVLAGCSSPRQKDCKGVMPLVQESKSARAVVP